MKTTNKVERSELFKAIYNLIKELPRDNVKGDAIDHTSLSVKLEKLFIEYFYINEKENKITENDLKDKRNFIQMQIYDVLSEALEIQDKNMLGAIGCITHPMPL